jgi:arylsulfatase A-like enzyme
MYYIPQPSQVPAEMHPTQWIGDRSKAFIQGQASQDEPWYLFSSFIHPHPPLNPPNPWHKLYRPALMPMPHVPPDSEALLTFVNRVQNRYKYRDQGVDNNLIRCIKAYYYACISFIDYQVGRILDTLERTGQLENTLILFTSDHGEYLGDYGCFGKRSMHDASARVPMILRQPGRFEGGVVCDTPVSLVDLAPTFLSAADATVTSHEHDGEDLAEVVAGTSEREMVFSQHTDRGFEALRRLRRRGRSESTDPTPDDAALERAAMSTTMAVSKEWKYFYSAADDKEFLFDRIHDPLESRNRKGVLFCQDALRQMRSALIAHLIQGGETAGIEGDTWKRFPPCEIDDDPDSGLLIQDNYTPWAEMAIPGYND